MVSVLLGTTLEEGLYSLLVASGKSQNAVAFAAVNAYAVLQSVSASPPLAAVVLFPSREVSVVPAAVYVSLVISEVPDVSA